MRHCKLKMKFVFVALFFQFSWGGNLNLINIQDQINYYEDLITSGIDASNHFQMPADNEQYRPNNSVVEDLGAWDFIVVGAGAGGAVVANRLSEVRRWRVLLIEAGGPETNFSVIPAMHIYLHSSRFNWGYYTAEQKHACLGMHGNRCPIVKGRALGGSTSINYEFYSRGNKGDFDNWEAAGNSGWAYDDVLPYFIKSENTEIVGDPGYHGRGGYLNVKYVRPVSEQFVIFAQGSKTLRNFTSIDYNGRDEMGVFQMQLNNYKQTRASTNYAFLAPIRNRTNLNIVTNAYVTKVLIGRDGKSVTGVQFARDGKLYNARARMEVILSAGAINTPQILMLSGIGPSDHLKEMKIPLVRDLPVGKTLYDHSTFYAAFIGTNFTEPNPSLRQQIIDYLYDYGILTIPSNSQGLGFFRSKFEKSPTYPDVEVIVNIVGSLQFFLTGDLRLTDDTYFAILEAIHDYQSVMNAFTFTLKAQSVGTVTLQSNDPYQFPIIDPNFLAEQYDVEILYEGIKILQDIVNTEPLKRINATLVLVDYPQCRSYPLGSKDYWICAFRLMTASAYHQCGTCRMGNDPKNSVVNNRGIVHGIRNLRVVDASIYPTLVAGHTEAPTVMIGERISDFIKQQYGIPIQPITNTIR